MISEEVFYGIYHQHLDAVFRLCLRSVTRRKIAEEICREVFLSLHQSAETITVNQIPDWLFTVTKQRCAEYWRGSYLDELQFTVDSPAPPEPQSSDISLTTLLAHSSDLSPTHRICIILRFVHSMSYSAIGEQTGLSEPQVKSHLKTSLQVLRNFLTTATTGSQSHSTLEISADA